MTEHYYSQVQKVESDPKYWNYTLRNHPFRFKTDNGVFSKREVDFGSRLLIETFIMPAAGSRVLDVGCGYGPIGLTIAKDHPGCMVHMIDVNERAIELAQDNAVLNQITNVKIYQSDRLQSVRETDFSAIVTNPPIRAGKKIVHDIFEQSAQHLVQGGELWVVIQKKQGAPSALEKLTEVYSEAVIVKKSKGYYIIKATK
ncbi:class I SAM-dependent methyltransferase [Bacillus rubiinfantis]|uniref:class I SAM-dependent methyltransferase n=1 Tax=Bacillus rubiinfantis TaxID=1499680 RepID=UPI0005A7BAFC|nr:class I SAM-dependent methyltransferase [Bacillus rubiinfantis]